MDAHDEHEHRSVPIWPGTKGFVHVEMVDDPEPDDAAPNPPTIAELEARDAKRTPKERAARAQRFNKIADDVEARHRRSQFRIVDDPDEGTGWIEYEAGS